MSILIKDMEMPKNCQDCALYIEGACYAKGYRDYRSIMDTAKPDDCPLVELPEKHGRLIDADELVRIWTGAKFYGNIKPIVDARPTVIEAEGETE